MRDESVSANRRRIKEARAADKAIRWAATYAATKGFTVPARLPDIMRLFAEMKTRLKRGSFRNVTHLKAYVLDLYGLPKEKAE